jgi:hypothetical protein
MLRAMMIEMTGRAARAQICQVKGDVPAGTVGGGVGAPYDCWA